MQVQGTTPASGSTGIASIAQSRLDRDAFMQLLVTQLENQDPLEPIKNEDFVAQLANFSSLEELEQLNENTVAMIALNQTNALLSQLTQGSALIGKQVNWIDPFSGATSSGRVESVKIDKGLAVLRVNGTDVPLASVAEVLGENVDPGRPGSEDETDA